MTRAPLFWLTATAVVATAITASVARGAGQPSLTWAHARYPERALVLTLPRETRLVPGEIRLYENGERVPRVTVLPAGATSNKGFGFVLVVDASNSMRGAPLASALSAAQAFAAERPPSASLGAVAFNSSTHDVLAPSTDAAAIASALSRRPRLAEGTRLRDGVAEGISLLARTGVQAGSVVVLSDGADTASRISLRTLVARARSAGVRVFTVGLHSSQFSPDALRTLAAATGATFAAADDAAQLEPIYAELGHRLAREYLLRYRSPSTAGEHVQVAVRIAGTAGGGSATLAYRAPGALEPFQPSLSARVWSSPAALAAIVAVAAALGAGALVLALRAFRRPVSVRLASYVKVGEPAHRRSDADSAVAEAVDRSLNRVRGWSAFAADVAVARIPIPARKLAAIAAAAALLLGPGVALLAHAPLLVLLALVPPLALRAYVRRRLARLRADFEDQLPDNLQVLASSLRAGHGLASALAVVVADTPEPARSEFERALDDERLGVPLEDALNAVAARMASSDLSQVALVVTLHRETGGNTAEVLDHVHNTLRERAELRRMVRALTAEGRMTRWVLTALPVAMAGFIVLVNRPYLAPLLDTGGGRALLLLAAAMVAAGSMVIKRIVEIEV